MWHFVQTFSTKEGQTIINNILYSGHSWMLDNLFMVYKSKKRMLTQLAEYTHLCELWNIRFLKSLQSWSHKILHWLFPLCTLHTPHMVGTDLRIYLSEVMNRLQRLWKAIASELCTTDCTPSMDSHKMHAKMFIEICPCWISPPSHCDSASLVSAKMVSKQPSYPLLSSHRSTWPAIASCWFQGNYQKAIDLSISESLPMYACVFVFQEIMVDRNMEA